jgi:hypothetical protein
VQFDALFTDGLYGRIGEPAIRAAARINYATPVGGERRYNFSEVREVNVP